jgi:predicted Zn-dependent protease
MSSFKLFALLLPVIFCFVGCTAPAPSAQFVAQADRLHDGAIASAVASSTDLRDYLQLIGDRVADGARKAAPNRANEQLLTQLRCHLVNCPTINAFYTGGNHVYVYSGLMGICENEDELAAAVAHEYAHAMALDLEKTKMRPDPNRPLPAVAFEFVVNRLTADQESAADELAMLIYSRAGWDPQRFPVLFEHLNSIAPVNSALDRAPLPIRSQRLRASISQVSREWRQAPVADPKTFTVLRSQAASAGQGAGSPEAQIYLRAFPNCMLSGDPPETRDAQEKLRPPPPPAAKLEPS